MNSKTDVEYVARKEGKEAKYPKRKIQRWTFLNRLGPNDEEISDGITKAESG